MHGVGLILEEISVPNVEDGFGEYIGADFGEGWVQFQGSLLEKSHAQIAAALSSLLDEDKLSDEEGPGEQDGETLDSESEKGILE
ncbi:hypothetical protein M404DRAFT_17472 [Pisolithus tinctorius Marx 270]|uniref:Uncharacterized protein n=1 Tax=Pisolithus tinctorius Marx 270 TaxID=870435 RepID=A0A0C3PZ33_PISTI|nr:hypothetical protein M404DRAFT_17472 [Pisolithus tinctorius Marx 270]